MEEEKLSYSERMVRNILPSRVCPVCGKEIVRICFTDYAYKIGYHTFCSWSCLRKFEKDPVVKFKGPTVVRSKNGKNKVNKKL